MAITVRGRAGGEQEGESEEGVFAFETRCCGWDSHVRSRGDEGEAEAAPDGEQEERERVRGRGG